MARKFDTQAWLMQKLRRISYQYPARKEAIKKARVSRGKYRCKKCEGIFRPGEYQLDHVAPVIDPHTGFVDWNTYIARLLVDVDMWQILCLPCHKIKSLYENEIRRQIKREKNKDEGEEDI